MEVLFVHFEAGGGRDVAEGDFVAGDGGPDCFGGAGEFGGVGGVAGGEGEGREGHCGGVGGLGWGVRGGVFLQNESRLIWTIVYHPNQLNADGQKKRDFGTIVEEST